MSNRIAFFSDGSDLTEHFGLESSGEAIYEPHYNISRGHHIPVLEWEDDTYVITRMRWGKDFGKDADPPEVLTSGAIEKTEEKALTRAVIPISGFYIWKRDGENDHPFFVRKIDNSLLYVAGFTHNDKANGLHLLKCL